MKKAEHNPKWTVHVSDNHEESNADGSTKWTPVKTHSNKHSANLHARDLYERGQYGVKVTDHTGKEDTEWGHSSYAKDNSMKKAQVDQGKSPEEKAKARGERHQRNVSTQFPGGGKADSHERRDIEEGKAPGRKGVWVGGDEPIQSGIQRSKNQFAGSKQKGLKAHAQQMNESRKIKPKLTKDESEDMPGEDLDKSKNVREQRAKVFGTKSQPAKGSPMRQKHMEHIRDYVKRKYGLELQSSGGKWDEKTQGRRSDNPVVGEDKPDWRSGQLESQDNPEAQVHELAHLEELPEGTDLPEGQRLMDRRYSDVQKEHGYMKQKRSQGEIQPMAMENPIRRRMGLPATDISTPVKPGQEPRTAVDTGGPAAVRVPQGNKQVDLIRQTRLRSPENADKQRQIDEGILTWTDKGWAPGTTPDAKINARQFMQEQGADPVQANQIAAQAGTPPMDNQIPEKMAASEGPEMDDETLRQMVKERFGVDLPGGSMDQGRIMKLAEQYAHGSARKPMKRFEAPDEAQLPDLVKPTMQKTGHQKGVHTSGGFSGLEAEGRSQAGNEITSRAPKAGNQYLKEMHHERGKQMHREKLEELKQMPKPNLPKSESMQKGQKPQENKYDSRVKGVHRPFNTKGDVSAAGWNARKIKVPSEQKAMHERVIQENRDIKPNLPKSEFIKK